MSTLFTRSSFSSFGIIAIFLCTALGFPFIQPLSGQSFGQTPGQLTVLQATQSAWEFNYRLIDHDLELVSPWENNEEWLVEALNNGTVLRTELIGHGVTNPFKAEIEYQEQRIQAVWKPLRASDFTEHESYPAEVAAYRLSKYLGIDMVPPTVKRKIGRRWGSLQLWVHGHKTFSKVVKQRPYHFQSSDQVELMRFFDALIDNTDRNAGNYLVDDEWRIVLIDHSRSMNYNTRGAQRDAPMPSRFQRLAVERLKGLDLKALDTLLGDLFNRADLRGLQHGVQRLLRFVDNEVDTHGPSVFFEQPKPVLPPPTNITQNR